MKTSWKVFIMNNNNGKKVFVRFSWMIDGSRFVWRRMKNMRTIKFHCFNEKWFFSIIWEVCGGTAVKCKTRSRGNSLYNDSAIRLNKQRKVFNYSLEIFIKNFSHYFTLFFSLPWKFLFQWVAPGVWSHYRWFETLNFFFSMKIIVNREGYVLKCSFVSYICCKYPYQDDSCWNIVEANK